MISAWWSTLTPFDYVMTTLEQLSQAEVNIEQLLPWHNVKT
ncbi:hypothetical protein [Brumicola pallidula]|uniref:Transposase IS66 C-terminal domain-containing protein n=1 Tax=Brumicola pallidula DSM 14239 = ACAM 615 TaxID=1121922 RepID=K6Y3Q3_9ALTE|nr:hypothetical protein [Glaciecola pallidula]GAC27429.1 hypothetical protein GPAL_0549 [Glaciecola pallidula DSM 14239 = ACAM 615]